MNLSIRYGLPFVTAVVEHDGRTLELDNVLLGLDFLRAVQAKLDLGELTIS